MNKIAVKPKNYSTQDIFKFYVKNLIKNDPSLYLMIAKLELYKLHSKDLPIIVKQLEAKKLELHQLHLEKADFYRSEVSIETDILDCEVAIISFEKRIKHIKTKSHNRTKIIDYITFKKVIATYNQAAAKKIIEGKKLDLLNGLGIISARRVERNFNNKAIDWGETNKLRDSEGNLPKKNGKDVRIFHIDEDWLRVGWIKSKAPIRNLNVYSFAPAAPNSKGEGFKKDFIRANKSDPNLRLNYDFYPYSETKSETVGTILFDQNGMQIESFNSLKDAASFLAKTYKDQRSPSRLKQKIMKSCRNLIVTNFPYKFKFRNDI
jgi:hypothetical protein